MRKSIINRITVWMLIFSLLCTNIFPELGNLKVYASTESDPTTTSNANLLSNAGFEETAWDTTPTQGEAPKTGGYWYVNTSSSSGGYLINYSVVQKGDTYDVHEGNQALRVTPTEVYNTEAESPYAYGQVFQNNVVIDGATAGVTYELSFWVKAENVDTLTSRKYTEFKIEVAGISQTHRLACGDTGLDYTGEWQQLTCRFVMPEGCKIRFGTRFYYFTDGYWLIDDFSLRQITEPTVALGQTEMTLEVEGSADISAVLTDPDSVVTESAVWTSSNEEIVKVEVDSSDSTKAVLTGVAAGNADVTVSIKNSQGETVSATCAVTVEQGENSEEDTESTLFDNLLSNAGFEETAWDTTPTQGEAPKTGGYWYVNTSSSSGGYLINYSVVQKGDTYDVHEGNQALRVTPTEVYNTETESPYAYGQVFQNNVVIDGATVGATYELSFWVKAENVDTLTNRGYTEFKIEVADTNQVHQLDCGDTGLDYTSEWQQLTCNFVMPESCKIRFGTRLYYFTDGCWLIDDFQIRLVKPSVSLEESVSVKRGDSAELTATIADPNNILSENVTWEWNSADPSVVSIVVDENDSTKATITGAGIGSTSIAVKATTESGEIFTAECAVTVTSTIENMLLNGDFEAARGGLVNKGFNVTRYYIVDGNSDSAWRSTNYWCDEADAVSFTVDNVDGYDGGMVLKISKDSSMEDSEAIARACAYQYLFFEAGVKYVFKAKVKPVDISGTDDTYFTLSFQDLQGHDQTVLSLRAKDAEEGWNYLEAEYEFSVSTTDEQGQMLRLNVFDLTEGYWLIDDVYVGRKPITPYCVITESGNTVTTLEMEIEDTASLSANVADPDFVLEETAFIYQWASSDETVATVDENGEVKAVGVGTAYISVSSSENIGGGVLTVSVTEKKIDVESITLSQSEVLISVGGQTTLEATLSPENATEQGLTWTSSDAAVVSVTGVENSREAVLTGLASGSATITVTTENGLQQQCTVNVSQGNGITVDEVSLVTDFGTTLTGSLADYVTNSTEENVSYTLFRQPENGYMEVGENGAYSYTPYVETGIETDSFQVLVSAGDETNIINGSIQINDLASLLAEKMTGGVGLLFSHEELARVKQAVATEGTMENKIWKLNEQKMVALAKTTPEPYTEENGSDADEWQKATGDAMIQLLIAYLVTGEEQYKTACLDYAVTSAEYPYWGKDNWRAQAHLAGGHQSFGLAMTYNWLKNEMDDADRQTIIKRLYYACQTIHMHWLDLEFWMQNHMHVAMGGLLAATLAIYEDVEYAQNVVKGDADLRSGTVGNNWPDYDVDLTKEDIINDCNTWLAFLCDTVYLFYDYMPDDGSWHEGAGYTTYMMDWLLRISVMLEENLGIDVFTGNQSLQNHSEFFMNVIYPANSVGGECLIDFAAGTRSNWRGPSYIFRVLAAKYQDETAQWIAELMEDTGADTKDAYYMGMFFGDDSVEAKLDTTKDTLSYFEELGIVVTRSDWSGDEAMLFVRSGLPLGNKQANIDLLLSAQSNEYHVDPDCNAIILYYSGEYLLKSDGYGYIQTDKHNTLLINGEGQIGEANNHGFIGDAYATYGFEPTITVVADNDSYSYLVGDATEAYLPSSNLSKYQRNIIFLKEENVLLVVDDIITSVASDLELRWFPESKTITESYGFYKIHGVKNTTVFYPFTSMYDESDSVNTVWTTVDTDLRGTPMTEDTFVQTYSGNAWQNAVAFAWAADGQEAAMVSYIEGNVNEHKFEVNGKIYTINVSKNTLVIEEGSLGIVNEWDQDSLVTGVMFNGLMVDGFQSDDYELDVEKFWKTMDVEVTVLTSSPVATANVEWDGSCPGTMTITCTSGDGSSVSTYTLNLKNTSGLLSIASASANPNTGGKTEAFTYDSYIELVGATKTWDSKELPVITWDLGSLVEINRIDVAFNRSSVRDTYYDMLISEDGETWIMVQEDATSQQTTADEMSAYNTIYDGEALRTRYVRFNMRGNSSSSTSKDDESAWNSVQEISFYGTVLSQNDEEIGNGDETEN